MLLPYDLPRHRLAVQFSWVFMCTIVNPGDVGHTLPWRWMQGIVCTSAAKAVSGGTLANAPRANYSTHKYPGKCIGKWNRSSSIGKSLARVTNLHMVSYPTRFSIHTVSFPKASFFLSFNYIFYMSLKQTIPPMVFFLSLSVGFMWLQLTKTFLLLQGYERALLL